MKAATEINFPNLRGFDKGVLQAGHNSYFRAKVGDNIEELMKANGYTEEEVKEYEMRIIKGNKHWLTVEDRKDQEIVKVALDEKALHQKRVDELLLLNKAKQTEMLVYLGVEKKVVPMSEVDRVNLIIELEKKKKR